MRTIQKLALLLIATALLFASGCRSNTGKEGAAPGPIKSYSVDFPGMQLRPGNARGAFTLVGRVRNRSTEKTITGIKLRLTMEDVLATGATTTVGETVVTLQQVLPPGDSKNFSENVLFKDLPSAKGRHEWNYSIAGTSIKE